MALEQPRIALQTRGHALAGIVEATGDRSIMRSAGDQQTLQQGGDDNASCSWKIAASEQTATC